jgi:hypothetical protein
VALGGRKQGSTTALTGADDGTVAWTKCKAVEPFYWHAHGERVIGRVDAQPHVLVELGMPGRSTHA